MRHSKVGPGCNQIDLANMWPTSTLWTTARWKALRAFLQAREQIMLENGVCCRSAA
jgi:hypothetical protein